MCPASVLISACLPFIYYLHSTSAAVLLVEVSAPDNNATQHTAHFNTTVDSFKQFLDCLELNSSSLCCLRNNFEVNDDLNRLWHQCSNMSVCEINVTALTRVDTSVGNDTTSNVYAALVLNLPTGCGFLELNVTAQINRTGITVSNMSYTYVIRIEALSSGLVGGLIAVMCFVCLLRRCRKRKTLELIAGDEHEQGSRASCCSIDSLHSGNYTNQLFGDIGEWPPVVSGIQCDLNYCNCTREFNCCSNRNLNVENCRATSREDGEYYNVSHSDVWSETHACEADAEKSHVYNVAALESDPENIYEVPVNRSRRESFDDCYVRLYDVQSLDGDYNITNCVGKPLPKKRSNMESVFYSEANMHNNTGTGNESFHYSEPVVFGGFKHQVLNVGESCSNSSYVNTVSAAGSDV